MRFSVWVAGATVGVLGFGGVLTGCKVETSREAPSAAGDDGATTFRVEPMNRDEVKQATNDAIEGTAEVAEKVKDAAVSAGRDVEAATEAVRERHEAEGRAPAPVPPREEMTPTPIPVPE